MRINVEVIPAKVQILNLEQTWMFVSFQCCLLSGRCLCDGPIIRPEESYWMWCVWVWYRKPCISISSSISSSSSSSSSSNSSLAFFSRSIRLQSAQFSFTNTCKFFNFHLWIGRIVRIKYKIIITKWHHSVTEWIHKARSVSSSCQWVLVLCFTKYFCRY